MYPTTVGWPVVPEDAWMRDTSVRGTANIPNGYSAAEVGLVGERQVAQVGELAQVTGVEPDGVEGRAVVRRLARTRARRSIAAG